MTSHCITWHYTTQAITLHQMTWPSHDLTPQQTSRHQNTYFTSKHKTSPPWNGRRLVHSKEMIWASRWSVALRTFYRQILSVLYSSFPFGNFRPRLVRALLVFCTWFLGRLYMFGLLLASGFFWDVPMEQFVLPSCAGQNFTMRPTERHAVDCMPSS